MDNVEDGKSIDIAITQSEFEMIYSFVATSSTAASFFFVSNIHILN